ncbi:hypothetical protein BH20ACI1_BH20ACI1_10400 [soil metagenome]
MKIILLTAAILMFSFAACAQNQTSKDAMGNKKAESVKTQRSKTEPLKVGEVAPDFSLFDQNGKKVTLSEAKNPVILVFYRGYW